MANHINLYFVPTTQGVVVIQVANQTALQREHVIQPVGIDSSGGGGVTETKAVF